MRPTFARHLRSPVTLFAVPSSAILAGLFGYLSMRLSSEAWSHGWGRAVNVIGSLAVLDALLVSRGWTSAVGLGASASIAGIAGIAIVDAGFLVGALLWIRYGRLSRARNEGRTGRSGADQGPRDGRGPDGGQ